MTRWAFPRRKEGLESALRSNLCLRKLMWALKWRTKCHTGNAESKEIDEKAILIAQAQDTDGFSHPRIFLA